MKLSRNHKILLDIVFQRVHPKEFSGGKRKVPHERVDVAALYLMQDLIKLEFYASLQKEIENNEEGSAIMVPNPYDVCLVEPTFRNRNIYIAKLYFCTTVFELNVTSTGKFISCT